MFMGMCAEKPRDWDRYLSAVLFAYREAPQESLGFSPFELLYGRTVRGPLAIHRELWTKENGNPDVKLTYQYVVDLKERLGETCDLTQRMLSKSSAKYKRYYDRNKRSRTLKVGDKALILLPTDHNKLLMQWKGPYSVIAKVNDLDYKLDVKGKSKTYHINLLKRYLPREECVEGNLGLFELVRSNESVEKNEILDSQEPVLGNSVYCDSDRVPDEFTNTVPFPNLLQTESRVDVNISDNLTAEQSKQVSQLLERLSGILTDVPLKTNVLQCEIHLTTDDPVNSKPYPVPYTVRSTIRNEVQKMLDLVL